MPPAATCSDPLAVDPPPADADRPARLVGRYDGGRPGPTTVVVASIHGNEPGGLIAARRLLAWLEAEAPSFRGRLVALLGNVAAVTEGVRHLDRDLNRLFLYDLDRGARADGWHPPMLDAVDGAGSEARERDELLAAIREALRDHPDDEEAIVLDLHTFSGDGPPFAVFADTLRNRRFCEAWPIPHILGLTEEVPGTLIEYLTAAGCIAAVVETGRHDDPVSAALHESILRLSLVRAGHLSAADLPDAAADRRALADAAAGAPPLLDVQHRHPVAEGDAFAMRAGYRSFAPVAAGEHLADDRTGAIRAERDARILLPLYQALGSDGFFLARPIRRFWLAVSDLCRRLGVPWLVRLLPGVRPHPTRPNTFEVDLHVARWLAVDVFHLLGFRRLAREPKRVLVARRQHDFRRPRRLGV